MANDTRVLFCLIEGDTNPFEVTVSTGKSISFLKKVIWEECKNGYARDLVLWKLNEPVSSRPGKTLAEHISGLGELSQFAAELQGPMDSVLDVFPEQPPKGLHIIVQKPLASSRKRRLVDHGHIIEGWRSKRRKNSVPSVEELKGVLEEPLVDSEKVPITESLYTSLISMLLKDRIANICHLINLSSILPQLTDLVRFPVDTFERLVRTNSTLEITSTLVIKTYTCENPEAKVTFLRGIYEVLVTRNIPNTDALVFANKNVLHLSPRGIAGQPLVEKELRECVICILESLIVAHQVPIYHRDIRWNNVIRRIEDHSKWFLIDWEDAARPPTKAQPSFTRSNHSPAIFEDGHGSDVDIWGVGHLIRMCEAADVSVELRALGKRICGESLRLSAHEVLTLVNTTQTDCM